MAPEENKVVLNHIMAAESDMYHFISALRLQNVWLKLLNMI